jgi:hypothetical protein
MYFTSASVTNYKSYRVTKSIELRRDINIVAGQNNVGKTGLLEVLSLKYAGATRMESAIDNDPELAIGTAKEFIETISKLILDERHILYTKADDFPALVKLALKQLRIVPDSIHDEANAKDVIKRLINNLGSMGTSLAELRNLHGTGHGKNAAYKGLEAHHARLAVRVAMLASARKRVR